MKRAASPWFLAAIPALVLPTAAEAAQPEMTVIPEAKLQFGSFAVFNSGSRTITPAAGVIDNGVIPLRGAPTGPAQFTIGYDRGNNGNKSINVVFEMTMGSVAGATSGGVSGTLGAFTSDLAGSGTMVPGQRIVVNVPNCRTRICGRTFRVGARLDVTRRFGGGRLAFALPFTARLISVQ